MRQRKKGMKEGIEKKGRTKEGKNKIVNYVPGLKYATVSRSKIYFSTKIYDNVFKIIICNFDLKLRNIVYSVIRLSR
jgi:hypothetical protein